MPRVGRAAFALGFAGLLPQLAVVLVLIGGAEPLLAIGARVVAVVYAALILSFLGGMWWGFAMRRERHQGRLVAIAVVPSLAALAIVGTAAATDLGGAALIALGAAIILTLPVDRHLARTGEAPAGWMRLRVPLSLGLGILTIAAGALTGL